VTSTKGRTAAVLLKVVTTFTLVSIGIGVLFDVLGGTFSGPQFAAEMLWIAGLFAPLLVGGAAALWVSGKFERERWMGARAVLRFLVILVSFASSAVVTTMAIRVAISGAPESVERRYQWLEKELDTMTNGPTGSPRSPPN